MESLAQVMPVIVQILLKFFIFFWILQFNFHSKYIDHRVWIYTSLLSWNHRFDDRQPCPNLWVSAKGQIRNGKRAKWTFLLIISAKKVYTSFIIISRHISTPVFTRKTPYGVKQQIIFKRRWPKIPWRLRHLDSRGFQHFEEVRIIFW